MRGLALAVLATALLSAAPTHAVQTGEDWSVTVPDGVPLIAGMPAVSGGLGTMTGLVLGLENDAAEERRFVVTSASVRSVDGKLEFGPPGGVLDPSTWVPPSAELAVPAEATADLALSIGIPNTVGPGDHVFGITVTAADGTAENTAVVVRVDGFARTTTTLSAETEISGGATWPVTPSRQSLSYRLVNTGELIVDGELTVGYEAMFGRMLPAGDARDVILLPGSDVTGIAESRIPPIGPLVPHAHIDVPFVDAAGEEQTYPVIASGDVEWVVPWVILGGVPAVILAGTGTALVLRRRRIGEDLSAEEGTDTPGSALYR